MAKNDITLHLPAEGLMTSIPVPTQAAGTDIFVGEPVMQSGNYAIPMTDGAPIIGTDVVIGVAASDSNHTASADGMMQVYQTGPGIVFKCRATTPSNMDTPAELIGITLDRVTFDLAGGIYTVDENEGDGATHGLIIVGGDINTGFVYFMFRQSGTINN